MKRIYIFAGHYGSGKTNLSVNFALSLREKHEKVVVCDVDTVNPYFRTKDSQEVFDKHDVKLIASTFANTNLDIPSISAEINSVFDNEDIFAVFDVGGDDSGAIALGQFADKVKNTEYEMFLVINKYRFMTRNPKDILLYKQEIEAVSQIPFTGIINNSNVGEETTAQLVEDSFAYAQEVSRLTGLPIAYTSIVDSIPVHNAPHQYPIKIYKKNTWEI